MAVLEPHFISLPLEAATEIRLLRGETVVAFDHWAAEAPNGASLATRLIADDLARLDEDTLVVRHETIADLSARNAAMLDLPAVTELRLHISGQGTFVRPTFRLTLRWVRANGQNVMGVERRGAWLKEPHGWRRLPLTLYSIADAVERHDCAADEAARLSAFAALRRTLPEALEIGIAEASGLIGAATILEADAFSLGTIGEGDALQIVPVLHRHTGKDAPPPLLEPEQQRDFGARRFLGGQSAQPVYALPDKTFVTIAPPLRAALEVVRRMAERPPDQRRRFLAEPRPALRAALGDAADDALLDTMVVETQEWSDRVIGLGLWKPRVLPWIKLAGNDWFDTTKRDIASSPAAPAGLVVGDHTLPLDAEQAQALRHELDAAMASGQTSVTVQTQDGPLAIPAEARTMQVLALIIKTNEQEREIEAPVRGRGATRCTEPACLDTRLKPHQQEGLLWLQQSWIAGSPGVLLADDMGLGKTLQGLAFLAWLREIMLSGVIARRPILVVAPTGLLENWLAEHQRHLNHPRLGEPIRAYGKGLADLRTASGGLDVVRLAAADWILTTYETLRDYITNFGVIDFAAMLIDEAQKVKTPAIRMTDAVKAIKADFRIAMTGTPVENRLSELWCIVDGVAPGYLGDLRQFSSEYEAAPDPNRLRTLKASLDQGSNTRPPLLLRRLKEDRLPELPARNDFEYAVPMEGTQHAAYEDALALGRGDQGAGHVLAALHRLRAVSLHPDPDSALDDRELVAGSARLRQTLVILDDIAERQDRALVFIESLTMMARLAVLFQNRYRLARPPMVINGTVAGRERQSRVDEFQRSLSGFDVMLISPKAGGVGLTLTRANHVIHLTRWWNPAVEDQCTARVLRIGQEKPVSVHIPMAVLADERPSFDQNLHQLLQRKRQMMRDALLPSEADPLELSKMLSETLGGPHYQ